MAAVSGRSNSAMCLFMNRSWTIASFITNYLIEVRLGRATDWRETEPNSLHAKGRVVHAGQFDRC
jgi:hypothetical protein